MDCRQFRKQHAFFIDDMLSGVATWAMRDHLTGCASCSRFDAQLRRSLLLARQAPTLELSENFSRRLSARLAAEKLARPAFREIEAPASTRRAPILAAAAAVMAIGATGFGIFGRAVDSVTVAPAAVVTVPAPQVAPIAAVSAPLSTPDVMEQPVHPAMLLAQRAAEQFAAIQARTASVRATH